MVAKSRVSSALRKTRSRLNNATVPVDTNKYATVVYKEDDAIIEIKQSINSLKDVKKLTENLLYASCGRIKELRAQKSEAEKDLEHINLQLINTPLKRQLSITDMVSFYKEKMNLPDVEKENLCHRRQDLENIIETIKNEILNAEEDGEKMSNGLKKLEEDILAMEASLEEEKVEKVSIMARYERDRQEILKKQEDEAKESAGKVAALQKKLDEAHAKSDAIVKDYQEKGYEQKVSRLQTTLAEMQDSLFKTQKNLTNRLTDSQNILASTLEISQADRVKISTYEKQILIFKENLDLKENEIIEKDKESAEKMSVFSSTIEELKEILRMKEKEVNEMEKKVIISSHDVKALKKESADKDKIIKSKAGLITSLEKEVKDLRAEMIKKEKEAEERLVSLRMEMTKKITEAELLAAAQLKSSEKKISEINEAHKSAMKKKDDYLAALKSERKALESKQRIDEEQANMRLDILRQDMAMRMKEAENAASASLQQASSKLDAMKAEKERTVADKDSLIMYLEGGRKEEGSRGRKKKNKIFFRH